MDIYISRVLSKGERGRYFSEGQWDILGMPLTDGYDAFSWMSNTKSGTKWFYKYSGCTISK